MNESKHVSESTAHEREESVTLQNEELLQEEKTTNKNRETGDGFLTCDYKRDGMTRTDWAFRLRMCEKGRTLDWQMFRVSASH